MMADRAEFNRELAAAWGRLEGPVERLDRLVLKRVIHPGRYGYGMWCYGCKQVVAAVPFVASHEWFDAVAHNYNEHVALCIRPPA